MSVMRVSVRFQRSLRIGVLLAFAFLSIGIHFFHTEKGIHEPAGCPACHFIVFSQSIGPVLAFVLPLLLLLGAVCLEISIRLNQAGIRLYLSRSPPAA
jgi:hypothetical protein